MKIAFLTRSLGCGGAQRQIVLLAKELHAKGHSVTVVVFYGGGHFEPELRAAGLPVRVLDKRGRWDLVGFLPRLLQVLREVKPDILYSYLGTPNLMAALLKRGLAGTRIVFGIIGTKIEYTDFDWATRVVYFAESRLSRAADLVIADSKIGLQDAIAGGFRANRMTAIPVGIDTDKFRPDPVAGQRWRDEWKIGRDELVIGMAARIDPRKDHEGFLKAAAIALKDQPHLRFVFAGDGTREYGMRVTALGVSREVLERTIFAGRIDDMTTFYNALDIATLASRSEGCPNVVGEAMACGVPCVVTDVGDAARVVGETGIVVPPADPVALAAGWLECFSRNCYELGRRARARILEQFSVRHLVELTEAELVALQ